MYSALRWERPAVRRVSILLPQTWDGVGKMWSWGSSVSGLNKATNLALIDFAAAPETWVQ